MNQVLKIQLAPEYFKHGVLLFSQTVAQIMYKIHSIKSTVSSHQLMSWGDYLRLGQCFQHYRDHRVQMSSSELLHK
jgi:hypothetical protein